MRDGQQRASRQHEGPGSGGDGSRRYEGDEDPVISLRSSRYIMRETMLTAAEDECPCTDRVGSFLQMRER